MRPVWARVVWSSSLMVNPPWVPSLLPIRVWSTSSVPRVLFNFTQAVTLKLVQALTQSRWIAQVQGVIGTVELQCLAFNALLVGFRPQGRAVVVVAAGVFEGVVAGPQAVALICVEKVREHFVRGQRTVVELHLIHGTRPCPSCRVGAQPQGGGGVVGSGEGFAFHQDAVQIEFAGTAAEGGGDVVPLTVVGEGTRVGPQPGVAPVLVGVKNRECR